MKIRWCLVMMLFFLPFTIAERPIIVIDIQNSSLLENDMGWINNTYNATYDSKVTDNESWNESHADTLYSEIIWNYNQTLATYNTWGEWWYNHTLATYNLWNDDWSSTYNATYDAYKTNVSINYTLETYTLYNDDWISTFNSTYDSYFNFGDIFVNETSDTMTGNLTLEGIKLEKDTTNHYIYDNSSCIIIKSGTTTLEICE